MNTFHETQHDRDHSGRFTEVAGSEQSEALAPVHEMDFARAVVELSPTDTLLAAFHRDVRASWPHYLHLRDRALDAAAAIIAENYPDATHLDLTVEQDKHEEWVTVTGISGAASLSLMPADVDRLNDVMQTITFDWGDLLALPDAEEHGEVVRVPLPHPTGAVGLDFSAITTATGAAA